MLAAILFIFGLVVNAVLFGMRHHGAKMPPPHGLGFSYFWVSFVLGAALIARYSYVLPLLAAERRGSRELFRQGVALAKLNLWWLRIVNGLEYAAVLSISHVLRPLETDGSLRAVAVIGLSLLIASVITTCFELIKAELAFGARDS